MQCAVRDYLRTKGSTTALATRMAMCNMMA